MHAGESAVVHIYVNLCDVHWSISIDGAPFQSSRMTIYQGCFSILPGLTSICLCHSVALLTVKESPTKVCSTVPQHRAKHVDHSMTKASVLSFAQGPYKRAPKTLQFHFFTPFTKAFLTPSKLLSSQPKTNFVSLRVFRGLLNDKDYSSLLSWLSCPLDGYGSRPPQQPKKERQTQNKQQ